MSKTEPPGKRDPQHLPYQVSEVEDMGEATKEAFLEGARRSSLRLKKRADTLRKDCE